MSKEELLNFEDLGNGFYRVKFLTAGRIFQALGGIVDAKCLSSSEEYLEGEFQISSIDLPNLVAWYLDTECRNHDIDLKEALLKCLTLEKALKSFNEARNFDRMKSFKVLVFAFGFDFIKMLVEGKNQQEVEDVLFLMDLIFGSGVFDLIRHEFLTFRFLTDTSSFVFFKVGEGFDDYDFDLICDIFNLVYLRKKSNIHKFNLLHFAFGSCERFSKFVSTLIEDDKLFKSYLCGRIKRSDIDQRFVSFLPDSLKSIYARKVLFVDE